MFYNNDILSRRKSGLGIVWLAATLGDRSVVRRLTRKDILSVRITPACEYLRSPTEPLALRLSSQLMYGVVKLYGHQMELLYQDVASTHSDVRRHALTLDTRGVGTEHIDMRVRTKTVDAITLPLDVTFSTLDFDIGAGLLGRWSVEPPETGITEEGMEDGFRTPTPVRFVEEERRITLPGAAFEEEELGLPRGYEEGEGLGRIFGEDYGVDIEDVEGLDLGLEGMEPARPEPFDPGVPEDIQRRDIGDDTTATDPLLEWPELEERLAEEAAQLDIIGGVPTVTPARRPREEEEEHSLLLRRRPVPVESLSPVVDPTTILSETQLRTARADYPSRMAFERNAQTLRKQRRVAIVTARQMMFGPPQDMSLDPLLTDLWSSTVGAHLASRRQRYRQMAEEARLAPLEDLPPLPPPPTPLDEEDLAEIGVARAAAAAEAELPPALRGARESLPWNVFMEHRRRSSMMPSISLDQPPTFLRETTPIRPRDVSIETPTGLRRFPPVESPLFRPRASPSTVAPLEEFYMPPPETPSVEGVRLGLPTARPAERSPTPPAEVFEQELEEETRNFYEYAHSIRDQLEDPSFLFFSDLAPVASSTPAVAAQAFYHTLALASGGRMKVKQDQAYGEIRIDLVN